MSRQVLVIGGGASGMMAAITAASNGAKVTILEHNDRIGKKILSTGNGRCNFTNTNQHPDFYHSDNESFPWKVIQNFPVQKTIAFFTSLGVYSKNKNGYLYPFSEQASAMLDVLRMEIERLGVHVLTEENVSSIQKKKHGFQVSSVFQGKKTHIFSCDAVILTTGSKAAAKLGSDGSGYGLAKQLGHHMIPVVPALVQLKCREAFYKALAGVRVHGKVSLYINKQLTACDTGEIQLTNYGISGIPVFQVSRYAARGLYEKKAVTAALDFMPEFTKEQFFTFLQTRIQGHPEKTMETFFTGLFHKKISTILLKCADIPLQRCAGSLSEAELGRITEKVKEFTTEIISTNPFEQAQICAGGIDTKEVSAATMESLLVKDLFFAGEILDVDGICGGYNLQWAWSSGYLAGKGASHA